MPRTASSSTDKRLRRIFKIHQQLRTMHAYSAGELVLVCKEVDTAANERTIRADIQFLRNSGAAIPKGNKHQKFFYSEPFSLIHTLEGIRAEEAQEILAYLNQLYHQAPKAVLLDLDKVFLALERRIRVSEAQGDPRLQFERTEYAGQQWIRMIYDYIVDRRAIMLYYTPFEKQQQERTVLPVFLKEYNQRWFLIAYDIERSGYQNFALDRIRDIRLSDKKFALDKMPDPSTFFTNLIGVTLEGTLEDVIIQIQKPRAYYVRTKRWHTSQQETDESETSITFQWTVYTNRELTSRILELGNDARVMSPEHLHKRIRSKTYSSGRSW